MKRFLLVSKSRDGICPYPHCHPLFMDGKALLFKILYKHIICRPINFLIEIRSLSWGTLVAVCGDPTPIFGKTYDTSLCLFKPQPPSALCFNAQNSVPTTLNFVMKRESYMSER